MDVELGQFDSRGGEWLRGEGRRSDIVISSRVRLARNLAGFPFLGRASEVQRQEIVDRLQPCLDHLELAPQTFYVDLEDTDRMLRRFLVERHLISRELESSKGPRAVAFGSDEVAAVMVNEEDHLRLQVIRASLALDETYRLASELDRELERMVEFAASSRFGYLTACPTNVGTGLRASVMMHLPALVHLKQIERVFRSAQRTGLTVRGFYGEGTMASGDLYQISNQITLGKSEESILDSLQRMLPRILEYEDKCRDELSTRGRTKLEDKCHRALAILRAARSLTSEEAMTYLSAVRLGVVMKILTDVALPRVNELFVLTQPAHLQKMEGRALEPDDRDVRRATFVRQTLS
ncbi:MAG: protein arginine kinase [Planctomycetota bacterium]|nr:protein arginine kinase [Planctomycetota bacterium]